MSHDTHDQNQGLDTPDTTPSIFRIIMYALIGYGLVSCVTWMFLYGFDVSDRAEQIDQQAVLNEQALVNAFPPAVYFSDPFSPEVGQEQVQQLNLRSVESPAGLGTVLGNNTLIDLILVDESIFRDESNLIILEQQLKLGKTVVGLRIPHSEMSQLLSQTPSTPDLERDEVVDAAIWVSVWYTDEEGNIQDFSKAYPQFNLMLVDVHPLAP